MYLIIVLSVNKLSLLRSLFLVFVLFCKTPAVHLTSFLKMLCPVVLKPWTWKAIVPAAAGSISIHSLSGATTYVTSSTSNSVQGNSGDTFNYPFWTGGNYRAYSFKVDGLPIGLSYNGNANAPSINGTLPAPGIYNIAITGYRYPGLSGNRTPTYNLSLTVTGVQNHNLSLSAGPGGSVTGGGSYQQGTFPSILASPNFGYSFASWSGDGVTNPLSASTTVNMSQARTVSAIFSPLSYPLTVISGPGGSASGSGIYNYGNTPSITASPSVGHAFLSWSGSGVTNPSNASTTVSMTGTRTVTANFQPLSYTLDLSTGVGGSASGSGPFAHGQTPTITATAYDGYAFVSWSGDGVANPFSASTSVNMTQARSVTANFSILRHTLSLTAGLGGSVSGGGTFDHGLSPLIIATPDSGYSFSSWSGSGVSNPNVPSTTVGMTQARSIIASFTPLSYSLNLSSGEGGNVSGSGSFSHGDTPTIVASPNTGYVFNSWVGAGVSDANSATTTISMISSRTATATFSAIDYTLSLVAQSGGSVSGGGVASYGEKIPINAIPDLNYTFLSWSGAGLDDPNSSSTFATITGDTTITANFVVKTSADHSLVLSSSPAAGGIAVGSGSYSPGTTVTISATPSTGYEFTGWAGSGITDSNSSTTSVLLSSDNNLTALFSLKSFSLSLGTIGAGTVSGGGSFAFGASIPISATPSGGYTFSRWDGSGVPNPSVASTTVSMSEDRNLTAVFSPKSYSVVLKHTEGGVASGSGTFTHGSVIDINASAQAGFEFAGWTGGSVADSNSASTQVTVLGDLNLTSSFIPIIHTLRLSSGGGGSVSGGGTFTYGDSVTITATPETNYDFSGWTGASFTGQSNSTLSFTLLADTNLTANFVKLSASSLSNAEDLGANWFSSWFGTFYETDNEWCYHFQLGWIYLSFDDSGAAWIWKEGHGWLWTDPTRYQDSFLWSQSNGEWAYVDLASTSSPRIYNYTLDTWSKF